MRTFADKNYDIIDNDRVRKDFFKDKLEKATSYFMSNIAGW
jgi:hypothetical protein